MARNRTINPSLWGNDQVQKLTWGALPLYLGCISIADDEGRFGWSASSLAYFVVGRRPINDEQVEEWMAEIASLGLVDVYEIDGRTIAEHPNWERYQYVNKPSPSKLPHRDGTYSVGAVPARRVAKATQNGSRDGQLSLALGNSGSETVVRRHSEVPSESSSVSESVSILGERDARARAENLEPERETTASLSADPTQSPVPAIAFARWFVEAGSAIGAIRCLDASLHVRRESLETAAALLSAHGRDECEARAHRLFLAHLSTDRQRIIRPPTIAALEAWWDSAQLRPEQRGNSDRRTPRPRSLRPIAGGRPPLRYVEVETPSGPMMIWKRVGAA